MPIWKPKCLRSFRGCEDPRAAKFKSRASSIAYMRTVTDAARECLTVELNKVEGSTLGIIISGGIDKGIPPHVSGIREGSVASHSDAVAVGDYITSVNGIRTAHLKHDDIVNLLRNAHYKVRLDLQYDPPYFGGDDMKNKTRQITLEKDEGSFGFTLRGGEASPPVIVGVRPGGPADREGSIHPGDRLLSVDGICLTGLPLPEALNVVKRAGPEAILTIEYDIAISPHPRPTQVMLQRLPGVSLGLSLGKLPNKCIFIDSIRQASIAERSGLLQVGDELLSINKISIDGKSAGEAMELLRVADNDKVYLVIQPTVPMSPYLSSYRHRDALTSSPSIYMARDHSIYSTIQKNLKPPSVVSNNDCLSIISNPSMLYQRQQQRNRQLNHSEVVTVTLESDGTSSFGLTMSGSSFSRDCGLSPPVVSMIEPGGRAYMSGRIQVGDRILSVNGVRVSEMSVNEIHQVLRSSSKSLILDVEFDIRESVLPSSGCFTVKVPKTGPMLGVNVTANKWAMETPIINSVIPGSAAHRAGCIFPGDRLLSVDSYSMEGCSLQEVAAVLRQSSDIVQLRIQKGERPDTDVSYTVELIRHGGPLGITISGTEEAFDPILISCLTPGGLAERTGALHVGDRLLAINGASLKGKSLSESILMLQNSGDVVTLKVNRRGNAEESQALPSVDSAVESWDSGTPSIHPHTMAEKEKPLVWDQSLGSSISDCAEDWDKILKELEAVGKEQDSEDTSKDTEVHVPVEIHSVTLWKDPVYEDFGFSVSDALHDIGVYINRVRKGGPADKSGLLHRYDRILEVNKTRTEFYDCCLTVPLIATAEEKLELVVSRNPYVSLQEDSDGSAVQPWIEDEDVGASVPTSYISQLL